MKNFLKHLTFNRKSLIPILVICCVAIASICLSLDFNDASNQLKAWFLIGGIVIFYLVYFITIMCKAYILPRNKNKKSVGVVFCINTHQNHENYQLIKDNLIEHFNELTDSSNGLKISTVALTEENVSTLKHTRSEKEQQAILNRTNCKFGIFIKFIPLGDDNDYSLEVNAVFSYPKLPGDLLKSLQNNFKFILRNVATKQISRDNNYVPLKEVGDKLYYICKLIYALANEYKLKPEIALDIFQNIITETESEYTDFYKELAVLSNYGICNCVILIAHNEYNNFLVNYTFDSSKIDKILKKMSMALFHVKDDNYIICYYEIQAITLLFQGQISAAKSAISMLSQQFSKIPVSKRSWMYSDAFLLACLNQTKKYWDIERKYSALRNNHTQNCITICNFIQSYLVIDPTNLGLKLALFWLIYYKKDILSIERVPNDFCSRIVAELNNNNLPKLAQLVENSYLELKNELNILDKKANSL